MNEDDDINLDAFNPSWMQDGGGISGEQQDYADDNVKDWDTNAWTDDTQQVEDFVNGPPGGCLNDAGEPPDSGTWILGSVDGTCQWIDTTTCS